MRILTRATGGSALARAALAGELDQWYGHRLRGATEWREAAARTASSFSGGAWLDALLPAFKPTGVAAARLEAVARNGGIVVTGGQQPGLFGGPLYVLYKAITLRELAAQLESATGLPVAPVFWAATDDADFVEASHVSTIDGGRLETLTMRAPAVVGQSMAATPLGDVSDLLERLAKACAPVVDARALDAVRNAYGINATVGSAYVALLRDLLQPLGVAVLDASHECVRQAGEATMRRALERAEPIALALRERTRAIGDGGFRAQVADVPNLSLVFETLDDGTRRRVPVADAARVAEQVPAARLGPNVLLRPIMERQILPTVTYVGGPGEVGYFAQVSAVADVMELPQPRIVPRWSGTVLEPEVETIMRDLSVGVEDFVDPHAVETRVARAGVSDSVKDALEALRRATGTAAAALRADAQTSPALDRSIGSMQAGVQHRLARLERRYAAAIKQQGSPQLRDVSHARSSLYPNGAAQERVLGWVPFLSRYGAELIDGAGDAAREHAKHVIAGG